MTFCRSKTRLDDKTVLITGANTGNGQIKSYNSTQAAHAIYMYGIFNIPFVDILVYNNIGYSNTFNM